MKSKFSLLFIFVLIIGLNGSNVKANHCNASHSKTVEAKTVQAIYPTAKSAGFTTLTAAIEAAGLEEVLTEKGPFTVFAPTDEAFSKLPEGTLESLLKDKEALKQVLLYHVVSGEVLASDVVKLKKAETLNGQNVKVDSGKGVKINDAKVLKTDIKTSNGVIHVIDAVLIPSSE